MTTFSIVVFAKNEENNIGFVTRELLKKYPAERIIFVLDGRMELTAGLLSEKNIKFIKGPGQGKGAAIKTAISEIGSDILVFMDADGSHNPAEIGSLLSPLVADQAEMVVGSRFLGSSEEMHDNVFDKVRCIGNVTSNVLINLLWNRTGKNISDAQNGFRSIKREVFLTLPIMEKSFSAEQEMVIKCLKKGYRICEVRSHERKRKYGRSHLSAKYLVNFVGCFLKNMFC